MKASITLRIWYVVVALVLWAGIYLTGFSTIHWMMYLPASGFVLAAITGYCPSHIAVSKVIENKDIIKS